MQTTDDIVHEIRAELRKPSIQSWIGMQTELYVRKCEVYRNWKSHIESIKVGLSGGLRDDSTGNHMFFFLLRRGVQILTGIRILTSEFV